MNRNYMIPFWTGIVSEPACECAAEPRDEFAPPHRLTRRPEIGGKYTGEPCIAAKAIKFAA
jgi:hypothetical protein